MTADINHGKIPRSILWWIAAAVAILIVAALVLVIRPGGDAERAEKTAAERRRERIEEDARRDTAGTTEEANKKLQKQEEEARAKRDGREAAKAEVAPVPSVPPAAIPFGLPPKELPMDQDSLARYRAAKDALSGAAPEKARARSLVLFEAKAEKDGHQVPGLSAEAAAAKPQEEDTLPGTSATPAAPAIDRTSESPSEQMLAAQKAANEPDYHRSQNEDWRRAAGNLRPNSALRPTIPRSANVIGEGTPIHLVTTAAINTKLPGTIVGRVTQNVFDSVTQSRILLPMGSIVMANYNTSVLDGQGRAMAAVYRIIYPNGTKFSLPHISIGDAQGRAGIPGEVNTHFVKRAGAAVLIALGAAAVERSSTPSSVVTGPGGSTSVGSVAAAGMVDVARENLERSRRIGPEIDADLARKVTLILTADLDISADLASSRTPWQSK